MKLIGMETEVTEALRISRMRQPILFYGPTGTAKTLAAWEVANVLSKELDVPVIYIQLYPEMTKNSLLGGETIKNGSIVIEEQAILKLGIEGAIFIIDECTHTTEPVLLSFNSLVEAPYSTVVGDKIYHLSDKTRFIFCGNTPDHAGNIHLPVSFANRLYIIRFDLPSEEVLSLIGAEANPDAPKEMLSWIASLITKTHEASFPISPRNMVVASRALNGIFGSGYTKSNKKPLGEINEVCKKYDIDPASLKRTIMSAMMAHVVSPSQGPEKIAALLW